MNFWKETIADSAMWISMSAAVLVTVHITQRMSPLWFFLIPAAITLRRMKMNKEEEYDED